MVARNKMVDPEQGLRSRCDEEQLKEKSQLKVAVWAQCKESNVVDGERQGDKLMKENEPRDMQKFFTSSCYSVEGLESKLMVYSEDEDLKKRAKTKRDNLDGLAIPKIENVDDGMEVKEEVEFGEERNEGKAEYYEYEECGKEKDIEKKHIPKVEQVKVEQVKVEQVKVEQVKVEYEEDIRRNHNVDASSASEVKVSINYRLPSFDKFSS